MNAKVLKDLEIQDLRRFATGRGFWADVTGLLAFTAYWLASCLFRFLKNRKNVQRIMELTGNEILLVTHAPR
jgi:hypothetical protein